MKVLMCIIFLFPSVIACSQKTITNLKLGDLSIVQSETGRTMQVSSSSFNEHAFTTEFGKPTSSSIEDVEAAGGEIMMLRYGANYFYFSKSTSDRGFRIVDDRFYVLIKEEIKIKVGESAKDLMATFDERRHFTDVSVGESRFKIPKINHITVPFLAKDKKIESNTLFSIAYNPDDYRILEISLSNRN